MMRPFGNRNADRRVGGTLLKLEFKQSAFRRRETGDVLVEEFLFRGFHAHAGL
jgi:hypothetical protein